MMWDGQQQTAPRVSQYPANGTRRSFPLVTRTRKSAAREDDAAGRLRVAAGLAVRVDLRFENPVNVDYVRRYESSQGFEPTDAICRALLRRIEHCSHELITRCDSSAMACSSPDGAEMRPLRFEMIFKLDGGPNGLSTTKTYASYQKQPLTMGAAKEIILAADRMIGVFFKRHDNSFRWAEGPVQEFTSSRPDIVKPSIGKPLPMCCIPRSRFVEETQQYDFVPGYDLQLVFTSRCLRRNIPEWSRTIKMSSHQSAPMTLPVGERALWCVSKALHAAIDERRMAFDAEHRICEQADPLRDCHHAVPGSVEIKFRVRNNLGPGYEHLSKRIESQLALFGQPDGRDCQEFACRIEKALQEARDDADAQLGRTDDLQLIVHELAGRGWLATKPFTIALDPSLAYSRRTIQAILDRVQTGIVDVLHGNDISITLTAHKRGHLILDKTLVAHEATAPAGQTYEQSTQRGRDWFLAALKERMQADIAMVISDTCCLVEEARVRPENLKLIDHTIRVRLAAPTGELEAAIPAEPIPESSSANRDEPTELEGEPVESFQAMGYDETQGGEGEIETMVATDCQSSVHDDAPQTPANAIVRDSSSTNRRNTWSTADDQSTLPSTPSLTDCDAVTPHDSLLVTPPPFLHTFAGTSDLFGLKDTSRSKDIPDIPVPESSSIAVHAVATDMDMPTEILGLPRQAIPELESVCVCESAPVEVAACQSSFEGFLEYCIEPVIEEDEPAVSEEIEEEVASLAESVTDKEPPLPTTSLVLEGWLEYSVEPVASVESQPEEDCNTPLAYHAAASKQLASEPVAAEERPTSQDSDACAEEPEISVQSTVEPVALVEDQTEEDSNTPLAYHAATSKQSVPEPLGAEEGPTTTESNASVEEPEISLESIAEAVADCGEALDDIVAPQEISTLPEEPRLSPSEAILKSPSFLVLATEDGIPWVADNHQPPADDACHSPGRSSHEELSEPTTPTLTLDPEDSDYSSLADPSPFPDIGTRVFACDASPSLRLWSQTRPTFVPDDSDSEPDVEPGAIDATTLRSRTPFGRPMTPTLPFARPQLHKRQYSSPTAGFLGLHEEQRVEVGLRNALIGSLGMTLDQEAKRGRRSSKVLTSLKYEKGFIPVDRRLDHKGAAAWQGLGAMRGSSPMGHSS